LGGGVGRRLLGLTWGGGKARGTGCGVGGIIDLDVCLDHPAECDHKQQEEDEDWGEQGQLDRGCPAVGRGLQFGEPAPQRADASSFHLDLSPFYCEFSKPSVIANCG